MALSYNKLWHRLLDKKMTRTALRKQLGISSNIMAKLGKDMPVNVEVLAKICAYLDCTMDDIMEVLPDSETSEINNIRN